MKKLLIVLNLLLLLSLSSNAQGKKYALYSAAFYNLENLFDYTHDQGKDDYEFLPDGKNEWDSIKYVSKLHNMAQVISQLARDKQPEGPAFIGVAEVENRKVLEALVKQPALASTGYQFVHYEGPDKRGIDCGLIYNPALFQVTTSKLDLYVNPNDTVHKTRGFLIVSGILANEKVTVIVNHWPSRGADSPARVLAGQQVRVIKDSLLTADPASKVIIMGDMNDDPMDESMSQALGAKREIKDVEQGGLYNPWWNTLAKGMGTLTYRGKWNLFDQIVVSSNLLGDDRSTLKFCQNEIFYRDFMIEQEGKYKGSPKRTFGGSTWLNGYSDHLPTIIYLIKEIK
ncbi:endonuclease/exonuclease/phosphatase family protein [uncultured Bacteroides sp.]|uniref:endonuclease/exonuclease/phosphatase family protein n=1 Tax=uncultured Bacteroides sp. TaxID=162156 RepID=UPI002AABE601|nr:endonuclease/exonuclease/phosphatase family protein [uncultured Bacteroides sp.]